MRRRLALIILVLLLGLTQSPVARANDAVLGGKGMSVYPISSPTVQMVSEKVDIEVKEGRSFVSAEFNFKNHGEAVNLLMGFPQGSPPEAEGEFVGDRDLHNFTVEINGQSLKVEPRSGIGPEASEFSDLKYDRWYTWQVNLGPGETARVRNTYWVTNTFDSSGGQLVNYILRTGSVWQDKIEKVELTISVLGTLPYLNQLFSPDFSYQPTSVEIERDRTIVKYILRELEPDRDINLYFLPSSALVMVYQQDPGPLGELARAYAGRDFQRSAELAGKLMAEVSEPWVKGELVQLQGSSLYLLGQWERARSCFAAAGENDPAAAIYLSLIARELGDVHSEEKALLKLNS